MITLEHRRDEIHLIVKTFAEDLWEQRVSEADISGWLGNFESDDDKLLALHLLSHFSYFGQREVREMLRAMYRDLVRYPVIQRIRAENNHTMERSVVEPLVVQTIAETRFLGVGNPSESGTHLLYYFRQENELPKDLFINSHRVFDRNPVGRVPGGRASLREPSVRRYIFIDDLCGSGTQAKQYSKDIVEELLDLDGTIEVAYFCLFGVESGLEKIRSETRFTDVRALFVLDESFKCFSDQSRYYLESETAAKQAAAAAMSEYGRRLLPDHPVGYKDGQLLLGFYHNVPDNVLPIIWSDSQYWRPIFRRYPKIEWSTP